MMRRPALECFTLKWLAFEAALECHRCIVVPPALEDFTLPTLEWLASRAALECRRRLVMRQPTLEQPTMELLNAGGLQLLLLLLLEKRQRQRRIMHSAGGAGHHVTLQGGLQVIHVMHVLCS